MRLFNFCIPNLQERKQKYDLREMWNVIFYLVKPDVSGAYRGEIFDKIKTAFGYILEVVVSGDKINGFKPIGERWIVERTFAWFDNYTRLCRNHELTFYSADEMVKLASISMLLNKIQTGSICF